MQYVCDAPDGKTWFRIETAEEAAKESALMNHAVEKHFRQQWDAAATSFKPASNVYIEQNIGLKSHVQREMPLAHSPKKAQGCLIRTATWVRVFHFAHPREMLAQAWSRPTASRSERATFLPEHRFLP